jgi:uncharacterized SAM-binding protein YcdF (DUF218 family)/lysophospholipase L1-like esterase
MNSTGAGVSPREPHGAQASSSTAGARHGRTHQRGRSIRAWRPGRFLAGFLCGLLAVISARLVVNETGFADRLVAPLVLPDTSGPADAIVVLGAGLVGECEPNTNAVRRVLLASRLWREGRAPALVFTGGQPPGIDCSVASVMAGLAGDLGVPEASMYLETASRSTRQNAEHAAPLLASLGARRIVIVTDRLHMPRAAASFAHFGYVTERASVPVYAGHPDNVSMLAGAMREYVALAYYRSRGWLTETRTNRAGEVRREAGPGTMAAAAALAASVQEGVQMATNISHPSGPIVILGASYAGGWTPGEVAGRPVINKGVSGQQSFELLERFEQDVVRAEPRAVIIWGFINDIFRTSREGVDPAVTRARQSFVEMIGRARQHGIEPILATEVTIRSRDSWLDPIRSLLGSLRGKEGYQDWVNRHVRSTNDWMRELARREGLLLLDIEPVLSDSDGRRRKAFATEDGSHIPKAGYDAITAYASPILERHLGQRPVETSRIPAGR